MEQVARTTRKRQGVAAGAAKDTDGASPSKAPKRVKAVKPDAQPVKSAPAAPAAPTAAKTGPKRKPATAKPAEKAAPKGTEAERVQVCFGPQHAAYSSGGGACMPALDVHIRVEPTHCSAACPLREILPIAYAIEARCHGLMGSLHACRASPHTTS